MKLISDVAQMPANEEGKTVEYVAVIGGWRKLDVPTLSTKLNCLICDGKIHATPLCDPKKGPARVRVCLERNCESNKTIRTPMATTTPVDFKRVIQWPVFCEFMTLGDEYHNVTYEDIRQDPHLLDPIRKFLKEDKHFLILQGNKGTGKTYAALGLCEYFTRTNESCYFTTQKKMVNDWLETFNDRVSNYINKVTNTELLCIDDFGTGQPTAQFMSFMFDLLNSRMQWRKRKTILTTNLSDKEFIKVCGDALCDRLRTGTLINFDGHSRRY